MQMIRNKITETEMPLEHVTPLYIKGSKPGLYRLAAYDFGSDEYADSDDCETFTVYRFRGQDHDDADDMAEAVNAAFAELCREFGWTFEGDRPAVRQTFNDWTDGLQRDGELCDDSAQCVTLSDDLEDRLVGADK